MKLRRILRETDAYSELVQNADELSGGDAQAATQLHTQLERRKQEQQKQEQQRQKRLQPQFDQLRDAQLELDQIDSGLQQGQQQQAGLTQAMGKVLPRVERAVQTIKRSQPEF